MSFLSVIYSLLITPIKLLFELFFYYAYRFTGSPGLSIVVISLIVNFLILPFYKRADEIQAEERSIQAKMASRIKRIKKAFKGDERFLMLQEYYRINHYKPIYALKSSVSLLLQIPFFIAAYDLLSGLKVLQGESFAFISDLGREDAMFMIGDFPVNVLPVIMTLINVISGIIYTKGHPLREKIQVYGLAAVFLVLLYRSPSGLVFYWLLNNVFSLGKNIISNLIKQKPEKKADKTAPVPDKKAFRTILISGAALAVLTGIMIPSDVIVQNPAEMTNMFSSDPHNPLMYLAISALISFGAFVVWIPVFTYLSNKRAVNVISYVLPCITVTGIVNYVFFNKNFGWVSNKLTYDYKMEFGAGEIIISLLVDIVACIAVFLIAKKWRRTVNPLMIIALLAVSFLSIMRVSAIAVFSSGYNYYYANTDEDVSIPMTKDGKNVVIIMMDKMNGSHIPYIFNERPDVAAQFDGFTYYPNTVSFGKYTNTGSPALFGGYDYIPERINARSDELLKDKQNEALLTLPLIFSENGWNVTVGDPPYANYQWRPDVSIYDDYEGITAYNMSGVFNNRMPVLKNAGEDLENRLKRNMFCYGLMKTLPYVMQPLFYTEGEYFNLNLVDYSYKGNSLHTQQGVYEWHVQEYAVLDALSDVTDITESDENCLFVLANGTTHDISLLKEPEYTPEVNIDNTGYDAAHEERFTVDGITMHMDRDYLSYAAYQCGMESCIALGRWFDYLRENGLYDNTRIIIVADHGSDLGQFDDLIVEDIGFDAQAVNPVLMVKDFNSTGFTVSTEFMTNADTPELALRGIVDNPVNPFTGNPIYQEFKTQELHIYISENNNTATNDGTRFEDPDGYWLTVHDNIFDDDNWSVYPGEPT